MLSNRALNFINTRLQQLMGTKEVFDGLSVIAVCDLYQLKLVGGELISLNSENWASSLAKNIWKELFTMYELVDIMRQKHDLAFAQLLNRLRLNETTKPDKQKLQTRVVDRNADDYSKDALHLFVKNDLRIKVLFFNFYDVMKTVGGVKIPCRILATTTVFITS